MMEVIKNNKVVEHHIHHSQPMFCFGGIGTSIEIDKIKGLKPLYWYGNDNSKSIPVVMVELIDGTEIAIDYETIEEVKESIKEFKKKCKLKVIN